MQRLKPPNAASEARDREDRKRSRAALASIVLHVVAAIAFVNSLEIPAALRDLVRGSTRVPFVQENTTYVTVAPGARVVRTPRVVRPPVIAAPSAPPLVAPTETPTVLPPSR